MRIFRILSILPLLALLGGCQMVLLGPSGDVALQQRNLLLASTALMLLVIVPVMALTIFFAWRYRASAKASYDPDWNHSLPLEVVIWSVPLLIIIVIGAMTWMGTHLLDPYRPLDRISAGKPTVEAKAGGNGVRKEPLVIQVVALDQKWSEQAGFGALACADFLANGIVRPNTQELFPVTKANSAEARAELDKVLGGG